MKNRSHRVLPTTICTIGYWLLVGLTSFTTAQYRASTIPSPKELGQDYYVSNPDGILNAATVDSLNRLARAVDRQTSAELAIVVVEDFVEIGRASCRERVCQYV